MSKVLIDRELLERVCFTRPHEADRYEAIEELRSAIAQPAPIITDNTETLYAALAEIERLKAQDDLESIRIARLLLNAGTPMSNAAYNLAQHPGRKLDQHDCDLLSDLRKRWDEAVRLASRPTE